MSYRRSMNRRWQVITEVEFNFKAATQGTRHVTISFNKRRRLASKGLVNLTGIRGANSGTPGRAPRCCYTTVRRVRPGPIDMQELIGTQDLAGADVGTL